MHERVDFGLAAIRTLLAGGGKIGDHLPPWYETEPPGLDDDALWSMLDSMTGQRFPEVKRGG